METFIPPSKALDYFARNYPNIWKRVDRAREGRKRADPRWPKWCYLPQSHARAIMAHYGPFNLPDEVRAEKSRSGHLDSWEVNYGSTLMTKYLARSLALLAGWRHTKGIYRFDPDVYQELINTPLDRALPSERLLRLPEWCVAIETPGLLAKGDPRSHVLVTVSLDDDTPQILVGCNIVPAIRLRLANTSIVDSPLSQIQRHPSRPKKAARQAELDPDRTSAERTGTRTGPGRATTNRRGARSSSGFRQSWSTRAARAISSRRFIRWTKRARSRFLAS